MTHPENLAPPPGARFNFAQHLITCNADRADKIAFIDDQGSLCAMAISPCACASWQPVCAAWVSGAKSGCCC